MATSTIKMRTKAIDGEIRLRALIKHPMATGLRKDDATGQTITPHSIDSVIVEPNGITVFAADWSTSASENTFLSISFAGSAGDTVRLAWKDNTGDSDSLELKAAGS